MEKMQSEILEILERAAVQAATEILAFAESGAAIISDRKADGSLVLNIDLLSQQAITSVLKGGVVVAEEDPGSHSIIETAKDYFLVDPIDGTSTCRRFLNARNGQVGFGPLVGYVSAGSIIAAVFYHIPNRTLYSAVLGNGAYKISLTPGSGDKLPPLRERERLTVTNFPEIEESAILFYAGKRGEGAVVDLLRREAIVENAYRFGGFANDCVRLALGLEEIDLQLSVRPWDLTAALIPLEAGYKVIVDPFGVRNEMVKHKITSSNPVLIAPSEYLSRIYPYLDRISRTS